MKITTKFHRLSGLVAGLLLLAVIAALFTPTAHAQACSGDLNGDGRIDGADLSTLLVNWGSCPASISSIAPGHGSTLGGTVITVTGTSLAATSEITIGGARCTNLTVLSPTQVRATTPPGVAGQAAVTVTTPSGTTFAPTPFTYVVQAVTSITPSSGGFAGGTPITITGQFLAGTTSVTVGGVPASSVLVVNSTTVTAVTPAGSMGAVDVVVIGTKGSITVPGGFTFLPNTPAWATLIEPMPHPDFVLNPTLREAIVATGWAWRVRDNATQIEMLLVPPGTFDMGCSASIQTGCESDENPVHAVTLTNAYYIGRYEVTQAQWTAKMGWNPSSFQSASAQVPTAQVPNRPVENVSWNNVQTFLLGTGLRLPSEAEWEYAYRAGTTTAFHGYMGQPNGTNDEGLLSNIAWTYSSSCVNAGVCDTRPVGWLLGNGFALHDMSGNVWEWVNDWHSVTYYGSSPSTNPSGPSTGTNRVLRGGSRFVLNYALRASYRYELTPDGYGVHTGFRVARNP